MNINTPATVPFEDVDLIGLAIRTYQDPKSNQFQNHVGIIYRHEELTHLFHMDGRKIIKEEPTQDYLWVDLESHFSNIDKVILQASILNIIAVNGDSFSQPFGFDSNQKVFDPETGKLQLSHDAIGLSCSSFILEIFLSRGFALVDWNTWPVNDKDNIKWQTRMLNILKKFLPVKVIDYQTENIGSRRYLPEEVTASTQVKNPATRAKVKKPSRIIFKEVKKHYKIMNTDK